MTFLLCVGIDVIFKHRMTGDSWPVDHKLHICYLLKGLKYYIILYRMTHALDLLLQYGKGTIILTATAITLLLTLLFNKLLQKKKNQIGVSQFLFSNLKFMFVVSQDVIINYTSVDLKSGGGSSSATPQPEVYIEMQKRFYGCICITMIYRHIQEPTRYRHGQQEHLLDSQRQSPINKLNQNSCITMEIISA